jgi:acetyl-CoA carboxylase carboxyltransferase component
VSSAPVHAHADAAVSASVRVVDGRRISSFRIAGGKHHGAIGVRGGETVERAVRLAGELQIPLVGELDTSGAELREHVAALHAWGRLAREVARVSGTVPTMLSVTGACVSGPALALGLFDAVVMTEDAFAYVTGPDAVGEFTGVPVTREELGSAAMHARRSGVATLVVADAEAATEAMFDLLSYLPSHHLEDPPRVDTGDPARRPCDRAATAIPDLPTSSYDVRTVLTDVMDDGTFLEIRSAHAPNLVTGFARLDGRAVGVVANQPQQRAGTLDIDASRKAARFVGWCDRFNVPLVTLVDTPGFEPGKDLEWRGMIRHGAALVHAYCAATVPRLCVIMRKAYGGAYIVMDSRDTGNDFCVAWPSAQIAVMGGPPAVQILHGKRLRAIDPADRPAQEERLLDEYGRAFDNPYRAAELGVVDAVIDPADTRRVLCDALEMLASKRDEQPRRSHSNTPL